MLDVPNTVTTTTSGPSLSQGISWSAVFAGVVVVLATQLFLDLVGLSIGAGLINPMKQQQPMSGVGTGAVIWFAISTLLSVFAGGWVAGRLAGIPRVLESSLHGIIAWGLASLATAFLVTTAAGSVVGGVVGLLGRSVATVSKAAIDVGVGLVQQGAGLSMASDQDSTLGNLKNQALSLLPSSVRPQSGLNSGNPADTRPAGIAMNLATDPDIKALMGRFFSRTSNEPMSAADKATAASVLVNKGNMTHTDAERTVDQWDSMYIDARNQLAEVRAKAEQQARLAGEQTASAIARTAAWTAVIMALGALAGAFGGFESVPKDIRNITLHRKGRGIQTIGARN